MIILLTLCCLTACTPVALPPPVVCTVDDLPPGVLAEADIETQTVTLAPAWLDAPDAVRVFVVAHEVCHLRGQVSEEAADCCAARSMGAMYGAAAVLDAALWLQIRGRDVAPVVGCVP